MEALEVMGNKADISVCELVKLQALWSYPFLLPLGKMDGIKHCSLPKAAHHDTNLSVCSFHSGFPLRHSSDVTSFKSLLSEIQI